MKEAVEIPAAFWSRRRARRRLRVASAVLLAGALGAACSGPVPTESVDAVRVRVGTIDPAAFDAVSEPPDSVAERIEQLVDLFWKAGCRGQDLSQPQPRRARYPDLVCRLPGRSPQSIVVAAYVAPKAGRGGDWTGSTLLPHLYAALRVDRRQHGFVFVGIGERSRRGLRGDLRRLDEMQRGVVRSVVDLGRLRKGSSSVVFSSPDPHLGRDLSAVRVALGSSDESLRLFALPRWSGSAQPGGIATTTIASLDPESTGDEPVDARDPEGNRKAYRSTARAIAVFLGYLDQTLRLRAEVPAVGAPGAGSNADER